MTNSIVKSDWVSNFNIVGEAIVNDYTFGIDKRSEKSSWVYNSMGLLVNCGEEFGNIRVDLMGGYGEDRENVIYAHAKGDDGNDDFSQQIVVDWDDRFDEEVLETVGDLCFITVGLEKTDKNKNYYKKFLSAYDAIAYIQEHLESGMVVRVRGQLKYSTYNDNVQVQKNVTSIVLSNVESPSDYSANFTQTVLLDKDSASLKNIDKDKGVMYVDARVLDYVKEYNGVEVKGQFPYNKQFEFPMDFSNQAQCKKIMDKVFKVKKDVTQITFDGIFIEGGATIQATMDDVPDDIKELIELGIYTEEEALAKCSANGSRERRMVLQKPTVRLVGEDKTPVLQKFEERYSEDDLILDCMMAGDGDDLPSEESDNKSSGSDDDMSWLDEL